MQNYLYLTSSQNIFLTHLSKCSDLTMTFLTHEQLSNQISCMKPGTNQFCQIAAVCYSQNMEQMVSYSASELVSFKIQKCYEANILVLIKAK